MAHTDCKAQIVRVTSTYNVMETIIPQISLVRIATRSSVMAHFLCEHYADL